MHRLLKSTLLLTGLSVLWAGCSASTSEVSTTPDTVSDAVNAAVDTGQEDGAAAGTDVAVVDSQVEPTDVGPIDLPSGTVRTSYISTNSYSFSSIHTSVVIAGFYDQTYEGVPASEEQSGNCRIRIVNFDGDYGFPKYANGGKISVTGGSQPVDITFGQGGYGAFQDSESALFTGGETVSVSSTGGAGVPAFSTSLIAPSHLTVTEPVVFPGQGLAIDKSADLTIRWTGSSAGTVRISIAGPQQLPANQTFITCEYDPSLGEAVIPASVLENVTLTGTGTISVTAISTATPAVAGWGPIKVTADMDALKSTGAQFRETIAWP